MRREVGCANGNSVLRVQEQCIEKACICSLTARLDCKQMLSTVQTPREAMIMMSAICERLEANPEKGEHVISLLPTGSWHWLHIVALVGIQWFHSPQKVYHFQSDDLILSRLSRRDVSTLACVLQGWKLKTWKSQLAGPWSKQFDAALDVYSECTEY